jgi:N-acetylglucosaminyldiphosphoundecaprenol N-acetyl-beta-D-mannosaminyltransferase
VIGKEFNIGLSYQETSTYHFISFVNLFSLLQLMKSERDYSKLMFFCDGFLMCLSVYVVTGVYPKRVSFDFTSIAHVVFETANEQGASIYIVGSEIEINLQFSDFIKRKYKNINIVGNHSGFFKAGDSEVLVRNIVNINPDYVLIGMGAPKQDDFSLDLYAGGYKGKSYTCGGFMHQTVMKDGAYYPLLVDKFNVRFLYRMYREPYTIKRYLLDYPRSLFKYLRLVLKGALNVKVVE